MGLFDKLIDTVDCPNCGEEKEFVFQTKSLGKKYRTYEVGDEIKLDDLELYTGKIIIGSMKSSHNCGEVDEDKMNSLIKKLENSISEDWEAFDEIIEELRQLKSKRTVSIKGDGIIKDGIFQGVKNIRTH